MTMTVSDETMSVESVRESKEKSPSISYESDENDFFCKYLARSFKPGLQKYVLKSNMK